MIIFKHRCPEVATDGYREHDGQAVKVVGVFGDGQLLRIEAADGWTGHAYLEELKEVPDEPAQV